MLRQRFLTVGKILVLTSAILGFMVTSVYAEPTKNRLWGNDRYDTAVAIAKDGWQQTDYAILAFGENYPDALAAAPLATKYNAPILLTHKDMLTPGTKQVLIDLKVKKVLIVGGEAVVYPSVENTLKEMKLDTLRFAGFDRYETAIRIAEQLGDVTSIAVATGEDYADALSIGSIAGKLGMPIVLVPQNELPSSVKSYLASQKITKTYVVGSENEISDSVCNQLPNAERITGSDKYERNIAVLKRFETSLLTSILNIATGTNFADALTGTSYTARNSSAIVLLPDKIQSTTKNFILGNPLMKMTIFGGEGILPNSLVESYLGKTLVYVGDTTDYGQKASLTPYLNYKPIYVKYGAHTYGSESQTQYDKVMEAIKATKATSDTNVRSSEEYQWIKAYLNGTGNEEDNRWVEGLYGSDILEMSDVELLHFLSAVATLDNIKDYNGKNYNEGGPSRPSAYEAIYKYAGTCLGNAFKNQAVFDVYGYNARVVGQPGDTWAEVQINSKWYSADTLHVSGITNINVISQPTLFNQP